MEPWKIYIIVMLATLGIAFCVCLGLMVKWAKEGKE